MKFSAKNPCLRVAANRWRQGIDDNVELELNAKLNDKR